MKLLFAFFCLLMGTGWSETTSPPLVITKSRVVVIERPSVVDKFSVNGAEVSKMFVEALQAYTGQKNVGQAWNQLGIVPGDVVGIKINAAMGEVMSTRKCLVDVVVETLESAGVSPGKIYVWDKFENDLSDSGWLPARDGDIPQVRSVIPGAGFDGQQYYINEIMGKLIWGDYLFRGKKPTREEIMKEAEQVAEKHAEEANPVGDPLGKKNAIDVADQTSNKSFITSLVTRTFTKIINIPVMSDHSDWGISGCLSSLAISSVDNTRRFAEDGVNGDPAIPEILDKDVFRKKVVLNIMDGLIAQYAGGPKFVPLYTQSIGALYLSQDPVAIDSLVVPRLEGWRREAKVVPIGDQVRYIHTAALDRLGKDEPNKIDVEFLK